MFDTLAKFRLTTPHGFTRLRRFIRAKRASVAVEMAFVLPVFAIMTFATWDAATIYTQYSRATSNLYSIGDMITTRTQDISCGQLDRLSTLVYESYKHGNWARQRRVGNGSDFTKDGAPDFRFRVRMISVAKKNPSDANLSGKVEWAYRRMEGSVAGSVPQASIDVPEGLRTQNTRYLELIGFIRLYPMTSYGGLFPTDPAIGRAFHEVEIVTYFPLRFVPNVALSPTPAASREKCKDYAT